MDVSILKAIKLSVQKFSTGQGRIISSEKYSSRSDKVVYGRSELDYHADTKVAGANFCVLQYTGKECDVSPYSDYYEAIKGVTILNEETDWKSLDTGQTYILVLHKALRMGDTLDHALVNPNQLRHYGELVSTC